MMSRYSLGCVISLLIGLAGCELVVPSSLGDVKCEQEGTVGAPACASGQICQGGACVQCVASEICGDNLDNDCNSQIDDGCESDAGTKDQGNDVPDTSDSSTKTDATSDVVSEDSSVSDTNPEVSSDSASDISAETTADTSVDTSADVTNDTSVDTSVVDTSVVDTSTPDTSVVDVAPDTNGSVDYMGICNSTAECKSGLTCISWSSTSSVKKCTKSCCRSPDCGTNNVCWSAYAGSLCVEGSDLYVTPGSAYPTQGCSKSSECRSGQCDNGVCVDACCGDSDCGSTGYCEIMSGAWKCSATKKNADGKSCGPNSDCESNYCSGSSKCSTRCCSDNDCPTLSYCGYRADPSSGQPVRACLGVVAVQACCSTKDCSSGSECLPKQESFFDIYTQKLVSGWVLECVKQ